MVDMVRQYHLQNVVYITFTTGGGTGGGLAPMFARTLRNSFPNLIINLVAFKSSGKESKQVLENTRACLKELVMVKPFVNNIYIVDNESRDSVEEVNEAWAKSIDDFLSLSSGIGTNIIDNSDLSNLIKDKGVSHILELDTAFSASVDLALKQAVKDSIYVKPVNFECRYLAVSTENNMSDEENGHGYAVEFDKDRIESNFFYEIDSFKGGNDYGNFVAFSGGEFPNFLFDEIEEEIKYRDVKTAEKRKLRERRESDLINAIATTPKPKPEKKQANKLKVTTSRSSKEIEDLFGDGFFDEFLR